MLVHSHYDKELRQLCFSDAMYLPLETIKEQYLGDILTKVRNVPRRGSMNGCPPISDEVPDSYLEDLLALRWRENLKLWTMQWDHDKVNKGDAK